MRLVVNSYLTVDSFLPIQFSVSWDLARHSAWSKQVYFKEAQTKCLGQ